MSFWDNQLNQTARDISTYNVVHTGPKTQEGGLNVGWIICEYQGSLYADVTTPPIAEAKNVIKTIIVKDRYLLFNISMRYNLLWLKTRKKFG